MGKISFYEMARVLVEHNGLEPNIANEFVRTMFDIIQERLTTDQQVKVKGLGTFKVVEVEPRESINVNTGERILIEGHSKISFTPDATMKELINKPFSQFETVMLNDGVNFEDAKTEEQPIVENEQPVVAEDKTPVVVEEPEPSMAVEEPEPSMAVEEGTPAVVEESEPPVIAEEPKMVEAGQPSVVEEEELAGEEEDADEETESRLPSHFKPVLIHLIYITVVAVLAGWGGYWYGKSSAAKEIAASRVVQAPRKKVVVKKVTAAENTVKQDTALKDMMKAVPSASVPSVKKEETKVEAVEKAPADDYEKYAKMDARVRTGAYVIVGEKGIEKVRKGETVTHFSRRMLGEGMECYIEVFNNINADTPLKEGQELKIPELRLKKSLQHKK